MTPKLMMALPLAAVIAFAAAPVAHAQQRHDNLLIKRVHKEHAMKLPQRGLTMKQVQARFGAPQRKLPARGGDAPTHPVIHRWLYPGYIVYFERNRVIHTVLNTPAGNNTHPQR